MRARDDRRSRPSAARRHVTPRGAVTRAVRRSRHAHPVRAAQGSRPPLRDPIAICSTTSNAIGRARRCARAPRSGRIARASSWAVIRAARRLGERGGRRAVAMLRDRRRARRARRGKRRGARQMDSCSGSCSACRNRALHGTSAPRRSTTCEQAVDADAPQLADQPESQARLLTVLGRTSTPR